MYNETVTVFNRHVSRSGVMWYPTVIHNINVNLDRVAIVAGYGAESADNVVLNVRYHVRDGKKMIGDKTYLPPKEWARQAENDLSNSLTFNTGNSFDFFVLGEWDEEPIADDEHLDGLYHYLNKRYDNVFAITKASQFSVIPHFEVVGE